jgi:hypothetical protein
MTDESTTMRPNQWTKSTASGGGGCVEAFWQTSTASGGDGCVEVRADGDRILVRDTKDNGAGPVLSFTGAEWDAFIAGAQKGEFNRA